MSAECSTCGNDLVYAGEWPAMECPVCREAESAAHFRDQRDMAAEDVMSLLALLRTLPTLGPLNDPQREAITLVCNDLRGVHASASERRR